MDGDRKIDRETQSRWIRALPVTTPRVSDQHNILIRS